ncbi:HemK2/MTQ2 family protein methyltransferase [Quadrisphaera sp. DSM 44207]|uniref:HemK2/MTQ2 family protein methyltransferase n=1 Tax=Quadrisphaera sp. DSM 44207 TaxID=1881057 RepID=UPI00210180BC|nr:HemK2/MTQ2 family protein methyltransferase [Quadrisphaera sp. DSM 44207]
MRLLRLPGTYRAQEDTWFLADVLRRSGLAQGRRVLDVCTGSGALAVAAAHAGARRVTAVDLSRRATATARLNSLVHGAGVRVLRGDLFEPVAGECFDLVLANPPYVVAAGDVLPRYRSARSWDAGTDGRALLDRICAGVPGVLAEGGDVLITQSALSDDTRTVEQLSAAGLDTEVVARATIPFGPVMRSRAALLEQRGLIAPGQRTEELVVVRARVPEASTLRWAC